MKTFTVAGFSVLNGERKMRVANSMDRVKVLMANGHTEIELQELPRAMTKEEIAEFLGHKPEAKPKTARVPRAAAVEEATVDDDEDPVVWLKPGQVPSYKLTFDSFEAALASVPTREKGRFLSQAARELRARELMLPAVV